MAENMLTYVINSPVWRPVVNFQLEHLEKPIKTMTVYCYNEKNGANNWGIQFGDLRERGSQFLFRLEIYSFDNGHARFDLGYKHANMSVDVAKTIDVHFFELNPPVTVSSLIQLIKEAKLDKYTVPQGRGRRFWFGTFMDILCKRSMLDPYFQRQVIGYLSKVWKDMVDTEGRTEQVVPGNFYAMRSA